MKIVKEDKGNERKEELVMKKIISEQTKTSKEVEKV